MNDTIVGAGLAKDVIHVSEFAKGKIHSNTQMKCE